MNIEQVKVLAGFLRNQ